MEATMRHGGVGTDAPIPILELKSITKRFGAVDALSGVDFEVYPSEVVALAGDNGAGKSTLVKIIAGTHEPDTGVIRFDGAEVKIHSPRQATHLGIETVYQDFALCDNLDVVANMFLGRETVLPPRALRRLSELEMEPCARGVAPAQGDDHSQRAGAGLLALWRPAPIRPYFARRDGELEDRPARRADGDARRRATHQVLELIKRLRQQGLGVVLISHNLHDVFEVSDRIVVLRLGRRVATFERMASTPEDVVAAITGARKES
jgi:D-xylose transport system ATP-binding protein